MNLTDVLISSKKTLREVLFEHVSAYEIFCHFIGEDVKVGKVILSPIRRDNNPTFILFIPENADEVLFKDFAWIGGDVFKFVKLYAAYNDSKNLKGIYSIVKYIDFEMGLGLFIKGKKSIRRPAIAPSFYAARRNILFKSRPYTERDLKFWGKYHINKETLLKYKVLSVHKLLNELHHVIFTFGYNTLSFAYVIYNKVKMYSPESKDFKWRNTCPSHYIQGLEQILKYKSGNRKLIITKSLKDVMVFDIFIGDEYDCIAPHSENTPIDKKILKWIFSKYEEVVIIYDFDLAGVIGVNQLRKNNKERFKVIFISTKRIMVNKKILIVDKDISDFAENRSEEEVYRKLESLGLYKFTEEC